MCNYIWPSDLGFFASGLDPSALPLCQANIHFYFSQLNLWATHGQLEVLVNGDSVLFLFKAMVVFKYILLV